MNRPLTRTEKQVFAYQEAGSNQDGNLLARSFSLFSHLVPNANSTKYNLFGQTSGQSSSFLTNIVGSSSIPNGQSFIALGISLGLDPVSDVDADQANIVRAFYGLLRNSLWKFARTNSDFDAYFHGGKFLPGVTMVSETVGNRVGDFARNSLSYKFEVPIRLGQNSTFDFTVELPNALGAGNSLVSSESKIAVYLDGVLVKKTAT